MARQEHRRARTKTNIFLLGLQSSSVHLENHWLTEGKGKGKVSKLILGASLLALLPTKASLVELFGIQMLAPVISEEHPLRRDDRRLLLQYCRVERDRSKYRAM